MTASTATCASTWPWSGGLRHRRLAGSLMADESNTAPATGGSGLTIEAIVAVDSPREFRIHPRDRVVAYTAEAAGARQLFILSLRGTGTPPTDHRIGEGRRRSAVVTRRSSPGLRAGRRDLDRRGRRVAADPGGRQAGRRSRAALVAGRPSPGLHLPPAGLEPGLADRCPGPAAARPATARPAAPTATPLTKGGFDVDGLAWSPDGGQLAVTGQQAPDDLTTWQVAIVDVATGESSIVAGTHSHDTGARWGPTGPCSTSATRTAGSRSSVALPDGRDRIAITDGEREHGEPSGTYGYAPLPSPDGRRVVHLEVHDGLIDLVVRELGEGAAPKRGRGRPPKTPRTVTAATKATRVSPWEGVWRAIGWTPDSAWVAAIGESERRPQDLWLLPVPAAAPGGSKTAADHELDAGGARVGDGRRSRPERRACGRQGARWPAGRGHAVAAGRSHRQARRAPRPDDPLPPRRPDLAVVSRLRALQAAAGECRLRVPRRRLPWVHRLRSRLPPRQPRRVGPRGHPRHDRRRPLGRRATLVGRPVRRSSAGRTAGTWC